MKTQPVTQLELGIQRSKENDRNYHLGGRSFYFFDFDDNVAFLSTKIIIFHKKTGLELPLSSGEYAQHHSDIGKSGIYADYEISFDEKIGSFRNFRDVEISQLKKIDGEHGQTFIKDMAEALGLSHLDWQGPSWSCFYHASFNQRPVSVITARGHSPETIQSGIQLFVDQGHLPHPPNYLSIYPVSHKETRTGLGDAMLQESVARLKQFAIQASVEKAIQTYGYSPHHRFGMSDDDPKNIQLIYEEMHRLKSKYPEMSFFLIETQKGDFVKHEIHLSGETHGTKVETHFKQYSLFGE